MNMTHFGFLNDFTKVIEKNSQEFLAISKKNFESVKSKSGHFEPVLSAIPEVTKHIVSSATKRFEHGVETLTALSSARSLKEMTDINTASLKFHYDQTVADAKVLTEKVTGLLKPTKSS